MDNYEMIDSELAKLVISQLEGVAITDPEGKYIYVNPSWCKMMDLHLEDVVGRYVRDVIPQTMIHKALKSGIPIIGHAIKVKVPEGYDAFSSYVPIFKDGLLIGGFIQVIIAGMKTALDFTAKVNSMANRLEYLQEELRKIRGAKYTINNIIGNSSVITKMKDDINKAARSASTVLIEGETGSGKELVAHSIHDLSPRTYAPFVKVNCAAIPGELLESEFFGYEEGSFTGAKKGGKEGKFQMANKGSLFLDEINQLPVTLQPKLLRVLQEREIERIGGAKSIPVDVRLIVASNVSLDKMVKEKGFRSDLFYRLNVIRIRIPPLRERRDDITMIADNLLDRLNFQLGMSVPKISEEAKSKLMDYEWPGNVRELQNVIERAMNMSWGDNLEWKHFKDYFENKRVVKYVQNKKSFENKSENNFMIKDMKSDLEKNTIKEAMEKCGNNKTKAAKILGISRTLLYKKMDKYDL